MRIIRRFRNARRATPLAGALLASVLATVALAQPDLVVGAEDEVLVSLDFDNAELAEVIDLIARMTNKNFIYDDRVRGRITIVSPTKIPIEQAYAVFESVLQVKGFTTVESPGGAIKVIPIREAKESSVETVRSSRRPPNRDRFVTRLIPLRYIEAEPIVATLKPLVSKDAALVAYQPTNTVILTESASNIRRLISILESIDVETYRESLTVIKIEHADAATMAQQISEIYGAEVGGAPRSPRGRRAAARTATPAPATLGGPGGSRVRIITDERTNSLIVLAPRTQLDEVRNLIDQLDVPVTGGGRIHVYYLNNANAEELASTLTSLISGQPQGQRGGAGGQAQALRVAVSGLAEGITITADPATNALVIQASQEGFAALSQVIEKLDRERPQVLVEALIVEVDITDSLNLGFRGLVSVVSGDLDFFFSSLTGGALNAAVDPTTTSTAGGLAGGPLGALAGQTGAAFLSRSIERDPDTGDPIGNGIDVAAIINAAAAGGDFNILSAPHILTSDNEQAEIRVGDNIPIITSRVQSAAGQVSGLSSSVNVERQDIGITLRVTPQITEGDTLRLDIFQELTAVNATLTAGFGENAQQNVGVALSSRKIENTVVVGDGDTVVIGGLISDVYEETVDKVPFLGDIPILGWAFKSSTTSLRKVNLLVFLTPKIIRSHDDLVHATIDKREEFREASAENLAVTEDESESELEKKREAEEAGVEYEPPRDGNPVRYALAKHDTRYPVERMSEIEEARRLELERAAAAEADEQNRPEFFVRAAIFGNPKAASEMLTKLVDAGYDGTLVSEAVADVVLYEVRLGPFERFEDANRISNIVRESHGLAPSVLLEQPEAP
ncbi:MAG: type II secretion system secretin GspD [Myxococcales bacterium]|nr:type II secretion system secretin GspD [Myxococcales bacterium]